MGPLCVLMCPSVEDLFFIYFTPIINHHRRCGFGTTPQYFAIFAI